MALTTDPNDPRLNKTKVDPLSGQDEAYLVLSDEELAKGFVRPVRRTYLHYVKECGSPTTMGQKLAETYAANPKFYGSTYCVQCGRHFPVAEFVWADDPEQVVGS